MSSMTVVNMSLTAIPLIAVVVLVRFLTVYKLPKKTFYVMWGIVLSQLLIPYNLFARFDVSGYIVDLIDKLKEAFAKAPVMADVMSSGGNKISIADTANMITENDVSVFYDIFAAVDRFRDMLGNTTNTNIVTATAESTVNQADVYISPILFIWIAGLLCCAVYFIVTHLKFRRIYEEALPIDSTFIRAWCVEYSDTLRRKVKIKQSDLINSPLTYAISKPVILLPSDMDYSDEATLKYILYHEYTHIWRFDTLSKLILTATLCIHWFNPFVWIMYILANRDIELSCDESVVRNIMTGANAKADYAATLITLAEKKILLTLGANFSKNIMKERIRSIMKIKKRSLPRIVAAVILVSMVVITLATLQSCENDIDSDDEIKNIQEDESEVIQLDENFVMQEQTDKLVVHAMSMTEFTLTPAVNIFKEMYPNVDVEIITFNDDEYETILQTELAGGEGPDLVFAFCIDFPDIYKTISTDIFIDLNQFIGRDEEFNLDDYVKGVLDGGIFKGKRYMMPIEYALPILTTTQEILDEEEINSEGIKTFDGFLECVGKYGEKYKGNLEKTVFSLSNSAYYCIRNFLLYSNISLVDYEKRAVTADKSELKKMMDVLKILYNEEDNDAGIITGDDRNLINRSYLFNDFYTKTNYMLMGEQAWLHRENLTPLMYMFPNINNGVTADIQTFTAIPKASKNQINAYNLMKIILSEEIQGGNDQGYAYLRIGNPVLKSAVRSKIEEDYNMYDENFDNSVIDEYTDLMMNINSAKVMSPVVWKSVREEMIPYFNGTRTFDDCYDRLVSKLELYISE